MQIFESNINLYFIIIGDEVIAFHDERQVYDSNRNVNVDIAHPAIGKGKLIASYAEIWVSQVS